jgi:tetratricopeptide (TPR) repeat protein
MDHFSPTHLRLCLGALPTPARSLLEHLLQCPECRNAAAPLFAAAETPEEPPPSPYDRAFEQSAGRLRERHAQLPTERAAVAARLGALLNDEPEPRWVERAQEDPLLLSPLAVEALLERGDRLGAETPERSAALARFALELADRVDPEHAPAGYLLLLRARAWSLLGLALSRTGGWPRAAVAFHQAARLVSERTQTDEEAEILTRLALAALRDDRAAEALAYFTRAARIYDALGETHREARCLRRLGLLHFDRGDLDVAPGPLAEALLLAEEIDDEPLASALRHDLAWVLLAADDPRGAQELLAQATPQHHLPELPALLLLLLHAEEPEEKLRQDLARAQRRGEDFPAAVHLLVLARYYVRHERLSEQVGLARDARALAASPQLAPATKAVLTELANALARGEVTVPLIIATARNVRFAALGEPDAPVH